MPAPSPSSPFPSKSLNLALWVVQALGALLFVGVGLMKFVTPYDKLILDPNAAWARSLSPLAIHLIGVVETAGGLGLLLPALLRILPFLTPLAGAGLTLTMLSAAGTVLATGGGAKALGPLILAGLPAFVAWGRSTKAPIAART